MDHPDSQQHLMTASFLTFPTEASPVPTLSRSFPYQGQVQISLGFGCTTGERETQRGVQQKGSGLCLVSEVVI